MIKFFSSSHITTQLYLVVIVSLLLGILWTENKITDMVVILSLAIFLPFIWPHIKKLKIGPSGVEVEQVERKIQQVRDETTAQHYQHEQALFAIAASLTGSMGTTPKLQSRKSENKLLTIGVLDFSESWLVSELIYQRMSAGGLKLDEPEEGESTLMNFFNMRSGHVDVFVWYTGTAMMMAGMAPVAHDAETGRALLNEVYDTWKLRWLEPLGFENREVLMMRRDKATELQIHTMSDLKERSDRLVFGANREFFLRGWAYPLLKRAGMRFSETTVIVDINDRYEGVLDGRFDVGVAWTTDPRVDDPRLISIESDSQFPSLNQHAIPICRAGVAKEVEAALSGFQIDENKIKSLNKLAELEGNNRGAIRDIANKFYRHTFGG